MLSCVYLLLSIFVCNDAARILGVFNHPGPSHTFLGKILLKNLAQRGHDVTMISAFPFEEKIPNYRDIYLTGFREDMQRRQMMFFDRTTRQELADLRNMSVQHTEWTFTNPEVKALLESNEKFDLVIIDWFLNEATIMIAHIFNAPVIYSSSFGNSVMLESFTGNTWPISYIPCLQNSESDIEMTFQSRAVIALMHLVFRILRPFRLEEQHDILKRHFDNPPTMDELQDRVALVLSNSHFSMETARPYTPNIIPVAGYHIDELKGLPKDLQEFLDSAKEGAVYFSLGSQIKSSNLKKEKLNQILDALGRLPQKVLWKYESEDIENLPKNIKISKWIPQWDVLNHPNVKLFINHGGALSFIEAVHFHVPILCMPFNGDQFVNAGFIRTRGLGLELSMAELNAENFYEKMTEILTNPKYQENAKYHASLMNDQPVSPLDNAIYWVEHVIRYKGAPHLSVHARKLPWYTYLLVDVILFYAVILWLTYLLIKFIIKKSVCLLCRMTRIVKRKID